MKSLIFIFSQHFHATKHFSNNTLCSLVQDTILLANADNLNCQYSTEFTQNTYMQQSLL